MRRNEFSNEEFERYVSECSRMARLASGGVAARAADRRIVGELQRLLRKKALAAEILKEALKHATGSKKQLRLPPSLLKDSSR
jgi:hypothetical protein